MKPSRNEIAEALLDLISDCGGSISTAEAYIKLAENMDLKESDFNDDRSGESWWKNEVRWTREKLVSEGRLKTPSESGRGIWSLSEDNSNIDSGLLPTEESDREYIEGSVRQVLVNKYERDSKARDACLSHYGRECFACGFDFKKYYGSIADGFIHVHHIVPISQVGDSYKIDPINDLVPLCANCHSVVHLKNPPITIEQLKANMLLADLLQ